MHTYLVDRPIPGVAQLDSAAMANLADASNKVLRDLGPDIQWVHSYVAGDQTFCIYRAENEEQIREHARLGGFPIDTVTRIHLVIDPTTAEATR